MATKKTGTKKRALGKGLSALLENAETDITAKKLTATRAVVGSVSELPIGQIEANPFQPRTHFEQEALQELSDSIKVHGIIQPITVRKMGFDQYQLISGERRFRASQLAGLENIPAYIRIANDQSMLEMALVENIQRENLDAIEIALSYQRLIDECNLTQDGLSEKVGKKRSTVTNYLRLLKLPARIQLAIRNGHISMGHARALVNAGDEEQQLALLDEMLDGNLSVRAAEALVKKDKPAKKSAKAETRARLNYRQQRFRDELSDRLESRINLNIDNNGKGKIVIPFATEDELERLMDLLDF